MIMIEIDPRTSIIKDRIKDVKNIFLVSGFKGGVGKSLISAVLSLCCSDEGKDVGLFDLDITSSSCHKILGIDELYPKEDYGLLPVEKYGIKFMSFYFFSKNLPLALRGSSISDAIKELLCVTRWGKLDYLFIDMPPGFYDVAFDVMNLLKNFKVIAVKTPSPLSQDVYDRMIILYKENGYEIIEVENMAEEVGGMKIRFDRYIDGAIGDIEKIKKTQFFNDVKSILKRL